MDAYENSMYTGDEKGIIYKFYSNIHDIGIKLPLMLNRYSKRVPYQNKYLNPE